MKRLIALRKRYPAFGRGTLEFLHPDNRKVLAFLREHEDETHPGRRQPVALRPARRARPVALRAALTPVELFGHTAFPPIGDAALPADPRPARLLLVRRCEPPRRATPPATRGAPPESPSTAAAGRRACSTATTRGRSRRCCPRFLRDAALVRAARRARSRARARRRRRCRSAARPRPPASCSCGVEYTEGERRDATSCRWRSSRERATAAAAAATAAALLASAPTGDGRRPATTRWTTAAFARALLRG